MSSAITRRTAVKACLASIAVPSLAFRAPAGGPGSSGAMVASLSRAAGCAVSVPGGGVFDALRTSWNGCWKSSPVAIAHPRTADEVSAVVRWARSEGVPLRFRSGGHSFIGDSLCDGLVVDMRGLAGVQPGCSVGTVRVGGGALIGQVSASLYHQHGRSTCTLGTCDSVGLSGLLLGGGFNAMSRVHGLTVDALAAAQVVLADGRVVQADDRSMPDLFWALRGGGASFGAVTELTLRTRPWRPQFLVTQHWPWDRAGDVLVAWSAWIDSLPPDASSSLVWMTSGTERSSDIRTIVRTEGTTDDAERIASSLASALRCTPGRTSRGSSKPPPAGRSPRESGPRSANSSVFGSVSVPSSAADAISKAMEARRALRSGFGGSTCMLLCNAFGGAVAAVPTDATAFVHRKARYLCEFASEWPAAREQADAVNRSWVRALADAVRPALGHGSYLNYADPGLAGWRRAYWGANVGRLEQVKRAVDPDRVFAGKQVV